MSRPSIKLAKRPNGQTYEHSGDENTEDCDAFMTMMPVEMSMMIMTSMVMLKLLILTTARAPGS